MSKSSWPECNAEKEYWREVFMAYKTVYGLAIRTNLNTEEREELALLNDFMNGFETQAKS